MAQESSFDVVSKVDLQEIDNALQQSMKEVAQRFDFKGSKCEISLNRTDKKLELVADDEMKLRNLRDIFATKLAKRNVSIKALKYGAEEESLGGQRKQTAEIIIGIPQEKSKEIIKSVKELKLKVQATIQSDQIRVTAKSKDDLQTVIQFIKNLSLDISLQFTNFR